MKRTASAIILLAATTGLAFAQANQGSEKGPISHPTYKGTPEVMPDGTKTEPSPHNRATPAPNTTANDKSALQPNGRPQK